ncbi:MAG TPA: xanthine dehydrogenase subunit D, partial [Acidimicrobiaceae bacterium]|nr:xanthine dehydrogenase subunit D [Acidimicrobiaceae bacterium]
MTVVETGARTSGGPRIGENAPRPDGVPKVTGGFAFSSDLHHDRMLWGATLRSPHPAARIGGLDTSSALAIDGVHAVLTHEDVPGSPTFGLEHCDQPVLACDVVRYEGEPVAVVAADHPDTARRALAAIVVDWQPTEPLVDPALA